MCRRLRKHHIGRVGNMHTETIHPVCESYRDHREQKDGQEKSNRLKSTMSNMCTISGSASPLGSTVGVPDAGPAGVLYLRTQVRTFGVMCVHNVQEG